MIKMINSMTLFKQGQNGKKSNQNAESSNQEEAATQQLLGENHSLVDLGEPYNQPRQPPPPAPAAAATSPVNMTY